MAAEPVLPRLKIKFWQYNTTRPAKTTMLFNIEDGVYTLP